MVFTPQSGYVVDAVDDSEGSYVKFVKKGGFRRGNTTRMQPESPRSELDAGLQDSILSQQDLQVRSAATGG